jgi:SAM-dependent methyltransferase
MNKTNEYYSTNMQDFVDNTIYLDMSSLYSIFEKYLKSGDTVLDLGFGSGRDSLYFSKKYITYSIDPVDEFVAHGKSMGLEHVFRMSAEEMNFENMFDGIWACASLLHVAKEQLSFVFEKCEKALKENGTLYVSFKYGDFFGERNGRYFLDLNEGSIKHFLQNTNLKIIEYFITEDVRPERTEKWFNVICRRIK